MTAAWHCRIGKVTPKGGKIVAMTRSMDLTAHTVVRTIDGLADRCRGDSTLAGFVGVVWRRDGSYVIGSWLTDMPVPRNLVPAYIHDAALREIIDLDVEHQLQENGLIP